MHRLLGLNYWWTHDDRWLTSPAERFVWVTEVQNLPWVRRDLQTLILFKVVEDKTLFISLRCLRWDLFYYFDTFKPRTYTQSYPYRSTSEGWGGGHCIKVQCWRGDGAPFEFLIRCSISKGFYTFSGKLLIFSTRWGYIILYGCWLCWHPGFYPERASGYKMERIGIFLCLTCRLTYK